MIDVSVVSTWGLGLIVAYFGKRMASMWREHKEDLQNKIKELTLKFETKTGIDVPQWVEEGAWEGVNYAGKWFMSEEFWRTFFRAIYFKQPERLDKYTKELTELDWSRYIKDQLSPELKAEVNDHLRKEAVVIARNYVVAKKEAQAGNIEAAVDATASAEKNPKLYASEPITKELMLKLIEESKARKEELLKKK